MNAFTFLLVILFIGWLRGVNEHRRRVLLLAHHLQHFQIEKRMELVIQGYLEALNENNPDRRDECFHQLNRTEELLGIEFSRFAQSFNKEDPKRTRISKIPFTFPWAHELFAFFSFDLRRLFLIHAQGILETIENSNQLDPKNRAFTLMAELLLMQHTCHWFCKSKNTASARLVMRHQTAYSQVLNAISQNTKKEYHHLIDAS